MINVEFRRIVSEWRMRFQRVREILKPQGWSESDWKVFSCSLAILVQKHGLHWTAENGKRYWDLRWNIREGGELICQLEQEPQQYISLVVAQNGGFAGGDSYTWLWSEFSPKGDFLKPPYWVEGTWKEALLALLLPYSTRAGFFLGDRTRPPNYEALMAGKNTMDNSLVA